MYLYFAEWKDGSRAWVMAGTDKECYDELILEKDPWAAKVCRSPGPVAMFMEKLDDHGFTNLVTSDRNKWKLVFFTEPDQEDGE